MCKKKQPRKLPDRDCFYQKPEKVNLDNHYHFPEGIDQMQEAVC